MHPRLRRLISKMPAPGTLSAWSKAVELLDRDYHAQAEEQGALEDAVRTLTALLQRAQAGAREAAQELEATRRKAARRRRTLEKAFAASPVAMFELTPDLLVSAANPAARGLCGLELDAMLGRPLLTLLAPLEPNEVARRWSTRLAALHPVAETLACAAPQRPGLACDFVCIPRARRSGGLKAVAVYVRDETARVEAQEARRAREEHLTHAIASAGDIHWELRVEGQRLALSSRWRELFGETRTHGLDDWLQRVHPDDAPALRTALQAVVEGRAPRLDHEHRVRGVDGNDHWLWARGAGLRDASGQVTRIAGLMSEVTRQRVLVERMAHDARHDPLTRLPNRTLFVDLLAHSFRRIRRHDEYRFAVLFIDLDDFKQVNDSLGHEGGDELLRQIARRLESCLRHGDRLARHAGDEFTMWLDDIQSEADALRVAARVHDVMREPFVLNGQRVLSSVSIGVAVGSSAYARAEDVLRDADAAMYRAKAQGKARTAVFERDANPETLEADLRTALARGELRVLYLPIVGVSSGLVEGLEALARWQHPRLGLVSPASFLAVADRSGLIISIDRFVLDTAARQLRDWRRELKQAAHTTISVNFSQKVLQQHDLAPQVDRVLRAAKLEPRDVTLDINEASVAADGEALTALHRSGVRLHMDDFGTGQAWLKHLHASELDSVKIDRSIVTAGAGADRAVLRHMVSIARELGKSVIAEGVETADQLATAREVGCEAAQGFYFSAPLDAQQAGKLLREGLA